MEYTSVERLSDSVALVNTPDTPRSFWSGDTIEDELCLLVEHENRRVWCSIRDVQPMTIQLSNVAPVNNDAISPVSSIEIIEPDQQVLHDCFVCDEQVDDTERSLLFFQLPNDVVLPAQLALHCETCTEKFVEDTRQVWDYTDDILPDHL